MISSFEPASFFIGLAINLFLIGSLLSVGVLAAFKLIRAGAPRVRYVIAVIAFLMTAALSVAATVYDSDDFPQSGLVETSRRANESGGSKTVANSPTIDSGSTQLPQTYSAKFIDRLRDSIRRTATNLFGLWFAVLWIGIAALLLARETTGHVLIGRARKKWHKADSALQHKLDWPDEVALYIHERAGPLTAGFLHPAVVLPARLLSDSGIDTIKHISCHELAHARWLDPMVNSILRAMCAALWPAVPLWLLARVACAEREAAADRAAIENSECASRPAFDYADSLVTIARWSTLATDRGFFKRISAQAGSASGLEKRIRRLLTTSSSPSLARILVAIAAFLLCLAATPFLPLVTSLQAGEIEPVNRIAAHAGEDQNLESLLADLQNEDVYVRDEVITWLGELRDSRAVEPLIALLHDSNVYIRDNAIAALGMIGDRRAVEPLIAALQDRNIYIRDNAITALGQLRDSRAVEPLIALLKDRNVYIRDNAASALGMLGDSRAVEPLKTVLADENPYVRETAAKSLAQLSGN